MASSPPVTPPNRDPEDEDDFRFQTNGTACEWGESYHPGGYHPVVLGDTLQDRYRIIRKLGYGSFSTAWLAVDLHANCFTALKIAVANLDTKAADHAVALYRSLPPDSSHHIVALRDSFHIQGPNGKHLCLSLDPIGPHLSTLLNHHAQADGPNQPLDNLLDRPLRFPTTSLTRRVLRDALLGLRTLHAHGIVHGDFHPGNILANIPSLGAPLTDPALETKLQQLPSQGKPLIRRDGKTDLWAPPYLLAPAPLRNEQSSSPPKKIVTPVALRAPEVILRHSNNGPPPPIGKAIDTWAFGCLIFELLTGRPLFIRLEALDGDGDGDGDDTEGNEQTNDEHLIQLSEVLGPLPAGLAGRWRRRERYFGLEGERLRVREGGGDGGSEMGEDDDYGDDDGGDDDMGDVDATSPISTSSSFWLADVEKFAPLEDQLRDNKPDDMSDDEVEEVAKLIRWILDYDTSKRPSVEAILEHPWFKSL
ncbi:kinase-like domain-containing protein [Dichotomopilus funicola]|uniref:non-specific serine/threonine protein kinase n=1 Tax=Dichotomopilus funicola TaxID=1934379 RepID=A0AAN6ZMS9_9PEZI|nr:kinase-like domain-containing protein [Dichotomopilus funicola]